MNRKPGWLAVLPLGLVAVLSSHGAVQFQFTFADVTGDTGIGFDDPTLGATRRNALADAASRLAGYFSGYTATIELNVTSKNENSGTLASASSPVSAAFGFQPAFVQYEVVMGLDPNGATADGSVDYNFFHSWGYNDAVTGSQYDFKAVTMHELMHTLGFFSFIHSNGAGLFNNTPGSQDLWSYFDQFVTDAAGNRLVTADFRYNTSVGTSALTGNPGAYFSGANAMAAYGGRVPLYSPTVFAQGSSISHTDDTTFTGLNEKLMNATVSPGLATRSLSLVELAILKDIGFAAVPEPETVVWWAGLGLFGWAAGRRVQRGRA